MECVGGCYAEKIKNIKIKKGNCKFMSYIYSTCAKGVEKAGGDQDYKRQKNK